MQQNETYKKDSLTSNTGVSDMFSGNSKTSIYPDKAYVQVYKRFERIAAVIYILSNRMPHTEVLRAEIRTLALRCVSFTARLGEGFRDGKNLSIIDLESTCIELTTVVRLLAAGKFVSRANVELVVRAIEEALSLAVGLQDSVLAEDVVITRDDLVPEQPILRRAANSPVAAVKPHISIERARLSQGVGKGSAGVTASEGVSGTKSPISTGVAGGSREATILAVLRKYGPLGIKDVAVHMPDCGEKTVQRALAALVASGSLRKEGEKRWSKYHVL
ncbi:MAG: hypothetical protein KBE09_02285 [Candidatus Pacebacteria bacterium]|nr:hypothetical protein [Candidatus Paceibacterota bacterium]